MKTFDDLKFEQHIADPTGTMAVLYFKNGYGISVITGKAWQTTEDHPYEIAILYNGKIVQEAFVDGCAVKGYLTKGDVELYIKKFQLINQ